MNTVRTNAAMDEQPLTEEQTIIVLAKTTSQERLLAMQQADERYLEQMHRISWILAPAFALGIMTLLASQSNVPWFMFMLGLVCFSVVVWLPLFPLMAGSLDTFQCDDIVYRRGMATSALKIQQQWFAYEEWHDHHSEH